MTPNDRTEPGVCPKCGGDCPVSGAVYPGYFLCSGRQPAQPDYDPSAAALGVCPACRGTKMMDGGGGSRIPCDLCDDRTGQQPAQPGSGEVVARLRKLEKAVESGKHYGFQQDIWTVAADEIDRLQSALTEAQRENAALRNLAANLQPGPISEALSGQRYTTETELRDQLTAAQQREAELREALRTYGWHKPECDYMQEELPCTCGFLTAVERDFPEGA